MNKECYNVIITQIITDGIDIASALSSGLEGRHHVYLKTEARLVSDNLLF